MQQVNSLPIILSQETEFNDKNSHKPSDESSSCFSVLVERYLESSTETSDESQAQSVENSPSKDNSGHIIAADGKTDTNQASTKPLLSEEQRLRQVELDKINSIEATTEDQIETKAALTETEEFISLLYYSDNALVEKDELTQKEINIVQNNSSANSKNLNSEGNLLVSDSKKETSHSEKENITKDDSKNIQQVNTQSISNQNVSLENNKEHKLKKFIDESNIKVNDVSKIGKNLTPADVSSNAIDESELQQNANREKGLLIDSKQTKETLFTQGVFTEEKLLTTSKSSELTSKPLGKLANSSVVEPTVVESETNKDKLETNDKRVATKISEVIINEKLISTSSLSNTESSKVVKASVNVSNPINQTVIDDNVLQNVSNEKASSAVVTENKVLAMQPVHFESAVKDSSANQKNSTLKLSTADVIKEQVAIDIEKSSSKSTSTDEYALAEGDFVLAAKASETPLKNDIPQTSSTNQIRPLIDSHNQPTQVKHDTSAYHAYEASVKVDQAAVSDVVQTQKNSVQLHQETISIFRKDFADAVKDKVMLVISQKLQQFDITLDPPEFGNMQVRVNLQGEQAAVNFVVQNQSAKEALEQNMHKLKEMLAEQGVDVGGADVQQQNQQQSEKGDGTSQGSNNDNLHSKSSVDSSEHVLSAKLVNSSASGVDYYV
jgi:flagellar hook-length control protein FliK